MAINQMVEMSCTDLQYMQLTSDLSGGVHQATHWLAWAVPDVQTPERRWHGCRWGCPPWLLHSHTLRKKRKENDEGRSGSLRHIKMGNGGDGKSEKRGCLPSVGEAGAWCLVMTALPWTRPATAAVAVSEEWNTAPCYSQNCSLHG